MGLGGLPRVTHSLIVFILAVYGRQLSKNLQPEFLQLVDDHLGAFEGSIVKFSVRSKPPCLFVKNRFE